MLSGLLTLIAASVTASAYAPEALLSRSMGEGNSDPAHVRIAPAQSMAPFNSVKVEYRYRTDDDWDSTFLPKLGSDPNAKRNEVFLKLEPKGLFEAREYSHFTKALIQEAEVASAYVKSVQLKAGYMLLIKSARAQAEVELAKSLRQHSIQSRRMGALQARASSSDAKDIFKSSLNADKSTELLAEIDARAAEVDGRLRQWNLNLKELDSSSMLSPLDVKRRLGRLKPGALTVENIRSRLATERARAAYSYEKGRRLFDEAQVGVIEQSGVKTLRVGLTLNLWFLATADIDSQRERVRLAQDEAKASLEINEASEESAGISRQIVDKIDLYEELLNDPLSRMDMKSARILRADPALANELQGFHIQRRARMIALEEEIRSLFIELMFESRLLLEDARVNHLSKTGLGF